MVKVSSYKRRQFFFNSLKQGCIFIIQNTMVVGGGAGEKMKMNVQGKKGKIKNGIKCLKITLCIVYAASPCRRAGRNGSQMWGGGQMIEMHINIYPWFKEKQCKISGFILLCFYISDIYALDTIEY